ncbi:MAG: S-layer homology domain-containing protein [Acidimicrobiia bacterium]|nr:S-layer homology domain-containing protein [Acidimicrobiia bacterium]
MVESPQPSHARAPRRSVGGPSLPGRLVSHAVRALMVSVVVAVAGVAVGVASALPGPLDRTDPAGATTRTFGGTPLDEVLAAAQANARPDCGLSRDRLAAMMIVPTFIETGAPANRAPGPMTLSRWDLQSSLYAFGSSSTAYQRAYWHPGVGQWQFDSAGFWPLTAADAIDARQSAQLAAQIMSSRYCASTATTVGNKMRFAWGPWYYCTTSGDNVCILRFREIFQNGELTNIVRDNSVSRYGGMVQRTCRVRGIGEVSCWYIDPAKAEGHASWAVPSAAPTPVTSPFYVFEANGREYRYWLRQDSGYDRTVLAHKPVTANARTSLTWKLATDAVDGLCDLDAGRGACSEPFGSLDALVAQPGGVLVAGWVIDPHTSDPIPIRIESDGRVVAEVLADRHRDDLGAAFPAYGPNHAFHHFQPLAAGQQRVCVYGVDTAPPIVGDLEMGCATVTVMSGSPFGSLDHVDVTGPGSIRVRGWTIDPDTAASIPVHVYVNGIGRANVVADRPRTDVAAAFPLYGPDHGFDIAIDGLSAGENTVCVFGIESAGPGSNTLLACRTVTLDLGAPPFEPGTCEAGSGNGPFRDVPAQHQFCRPIEWLVEAGLSSGFPDGTFLPTSPVSRQAVAAFLHRLAGEPASGASEPSFDDVPASHPFFEAIQWMAATGVSTGTPQPDGSTLFAPASPVSRQAVAAFLHRLAGEPASGLSEPFFDDVPANHPNFEAIQWMAAVELSTGSIGADGSRRFAPGEVISRQAMAAFLHRSAAGAT